MDHEEAKEWKPRAMRHCRQKGPFAIAVVFTLLNVASAIPTGGQETTSEGTNVRNYNIHQSLELGYRFTDFTGSQAVYNTFVNLGQGFRLFEQSLQMRSLNHQGLLFDNLYLSSFGYGGDPNAATRLRVYKNKWYDFSGTFRRDKNFWDYNLLANPLNPPTSNPNVPVTSSPHLFNTVRRISDFNLTLLPQSRFRVRLGYARNISEGPSFSTIHEGTEAVTFQSWKTTINAYRIGFDFKLAPRTNLSYDEFLSYSKGDTSWADKSLVLLQLSNGRPVDLGIIFNTTAGQPCGVPISNPSTTPPTANASCNGYLGYGRLGRSRSSVPTEQLSFQSNYFRSVDMSGRFSYSSSDGQVPDFGETFSGLITRTIVHAFSNSGPATSKRVSVTADWAITWRLTSNFRIVDTFRFSNFRLPGNWAFAENNFFAGPGAPSMLQSTVTFNPATCPSTPSTCPQHNANSPPDISTGLSSLFLAQDSKYNTLLLEYDFTKRFGGSLGYRYGHRTITQTDAESFNDIFFPALPNRGACAGQPLQSDGSCHFSDSSTDSEFTEINEHSALLGLWARPIDALRINFDVELFAADRSFTRISPRQLQHYKARVTYKPSRWMSFSTALNILENRNNVPDINNKQHNRSYGFSAAFEPNERFGLDTGYDYNDIFSQTNICFFFGAVPPPASVICPAGPGNSLSAISLYTNTTHFGYFNLVWKPVRRVTTNLGYAVSSVNGNTLILNPNAPVGPLQYNFHKPYGSLAVDLLKGLTWKASWGYFSYSEKALPGPTGSRDFRGNLVSLSLRYAF